MFWEVGMEKHAVYTGTRNLYGDMVASAKSVVLNSDVDKIHFLIEDDVFPYDVPDIIECHNVSGQTFFPPDGANMKCRFSYMALMRAALCHVFPNLDEILSLDVDLIAVRDISGAWEIDVSDDYLAACFEPVMCNGDHGLHYVNVGVVLYNLAKLRDGKANEVIDVLNRYMYANVEQDVFSYLCNGRIAYMPPEYNATRYTEPCEEPRIVHFAGYKHAEWSKRPEFERFRKMSWEEVLANRLESQR